MTLKLVILTSLLAFTPLKVNALSHCCDELNLILPDKTYGPLQQPYHETIQSYFSGQEADLRPHCIVKPTETKDVTRILQTISHRFRINLASCEFAIRSGGRSPLAGAANRQGGVTIDLGQMNAIQVNSDKNLTSIGAGATWGEVYSALDPLNLTVPGSRINDVGVGGLITGGGLSFFSPKRGFVADDVVNFELVLANGSVIDANMSSQPDLTMALRGGSNNFGIVTRFDLATFEQGDLRGGDIVNSFDAVPKVIQALTDFYASPDYDENAAVYTLFIYLQGTGPVVSQNLVYTRDTPNPVALRPFTDIPQLSSTVRSGKMSNLTVSVDAAYQQRRRVFLTTTWKNDVSTSEEAVRLWNQSLSEICDVPGLIYHIDLEAIVPATSLKSASRGGNSLGINPNDGPLIVALISGQWDNSSDDIRMENTLALLVVAIERISKSKGTFHPFKYLEYANKGQPVISGYGKTSKGRLKRVSKEVDPRGLFQKAVPGGFKLH